MEKLSELEEYRPVALYTKTEPIPRVRIVGYNSPLYYANSELFLRYVYDETGVKPETMRKTLKKLTTLNDPLHANKKKLNDSKIVAIETVTAVGPTNAGGVDGTSNGDMAKARMTHRASIIGPMPNLDPRPFLYLIIDCTAFTFIDPVGIKILKQLIADYKTIGITTYLGGVRDSCWSTMEASGFTDTYERVIFLTVRDAVLAAEEDKRKRQHPIPDMMNTIRDTSQTLDEESENSSATMHDPLLSNENSYHEDDDDQDDSNRNVADLRLLDEQGRELDVFYSTNGKPPSSDTDIV